MRKVLTLLGVVGIVVTVLAAAPAVRAAEEGQPKGKIFELRTYTTNPGKLADLHKRFRDHTCDLFKKHGIELVGFWTPTEGPEAQNTLIYVVAFPSVEAQKKAWKGFGSDPVWKKAFAESHKNGIIVNKVESKTMTATDYSPIR
jgi:hypothetical protein